MSAWAPKRFWKTAAVEACDSGYTVRLDTRLVKTPAKRALAVPTSAMAQVIAAEWDAQHGLIRPETMPFTRAANSAIDKVAPLFDAVVDEVAGFGATDLLCYRAEGPGPLADRHAAGWDPLIAWAATDLDAPLRVTTGVIPVPQPNHSLARLRSFVEGHSPFQMMALHDLVSISGSLILGLAVTRKRVAADHAFELSRIDEQWQIEQWGADEEAAASTAFKRTAFLTAERFYGLCG